VEFVVALHLISCLHNYQSQTYGDVDVSSIPFQLPQSFGTGRDNSNVLSFWPTIHVKMWDTSQAIEDDIEKIKEIEEQQQQNNNNSDVVSHETTIEPKTYENEGITENKMTLCKQLEEERTKYEMEIQKLHHVSQLAGKHMALAKTYFESMKSIRASLAKSEEEEDKNDPKNENNSPPPPEVESLEKKEKEIIHMRNEVHGFIETQHSTDRLLCVCCYTNAKEIVFHPCAHCVCCERCSSKIDSKCPVCRVEIEYTTLVHWT